MIRILLACLTLQASPPAEAAWPGHAAEAAFTAVKTKSLPESLREALKRWDELTPGKDALPEELKVARVDLNGDRVDDFIVQSGQVSSGGPAMLVFEQRGGTFIVVAHVQGSIYLAPPVNGYFDIVTQARGGAGDYTRILWRYAQSGTGYVMTRVADYREAEPGGALLFVRERNALLPRPLGPRPESTLTESQRRMRDTKLRQIQEIQDTKSASPTLREFLGGPIKAITVTTVDGSIGTWSTAEKWLDDLLSSLLVQPHSEGPFAFQAWSEMTFAMITATIRYDDGAVGRVETDGRAHLFVEDHDGIGWWYRWSPDFPRVKR